MSGNVKMDQLCFSVELCQKYQKLCHIGWNRFLRQFDSEFAINQSTGVCSIKSRGNPLYKTYEVFYNFVFAIFLQTFAQPIFSLKVTQSGPKLDLTFLLQYKHHKVKLLWGNTFITFVKKFR